MVLYTLGFAGWTVDQIKTEADRLEATVLDIRWRPVSNDAAFQKMALLAVLGRRYKYLRALGNVEDKAGGMRIANPDEGIHVVRQSMTITRGPMILMCHCASYDRCHRKVAAELVAASLGLEIKHLMKPVTVGAR